MALTFGWETCRSIFAEPNIGDLLRSHWEELAVHKDAMPLDPDYARYIALNEAGVLRIWTARDEQVKGRSTLVGYIVWYILPHTHYKDTLTAIDDLYLLAAPYRVGSNGWRMFRSTLDALRQMTVKRVIIHEKVHFQAERGGLGSLLRRLGLKHTDNVWSMML